MKMKMKGMIVVALMATMAAFVACETPTSSTYAYVPPGQTEREPEPEPTSTNEGKKFSVEVSYIHIGNYKTQTLTLKTPIIADMRDIGQNRYDYGNTSPYIKEGVFNVVYVFYGNTKEWILTVNPGGSGIDVINSQFSSSRNEFEWL